MITRRAAARAALALLAALSVAPVAAAAAQDDGAPTVTIDRTGAKAGETLVVQGSGWSGTELVYLELCGNGGRNGSSSCDQGHATLTGLGPEGTFSARLTVAKPPVPCPCVVKATSQTTQAWASADLAVQDVPVVPLEDQPTTAQVQRSVAITARFTGQGPWTSWFGQAAQRTLVLTVTNTGAVAVHDPPLTITAGKGADPKGVVPAPELGTIEPGESITVEVPLRFSPLSFGQQSARASIAGFAEPVGTLAATSTYPWALIALAAVLTQLGLLRLRNKVRRRVGAHAAGKGASGRTDVEPTPAPADEVDVETPAADVLVPAVGMMSAAREETDTGLPSTEAPAAVVVAVDDEVDQVEAEADADADAEVDAAADADAEAEVADDEDDEDEATSGTAGIHAPEAAVVIDLRNADAMGSPWPRGPEGHEVASADGHLPNPFEQPSGAQAAGALELARRIGTEGRMLRSGISAQRSAAQAVLAEASVAAAAILSAATTQADEVVAGARVAQAEVATALDQAQRAVEALLAEARSQAQAIHADVERHQVALRHAADEGGAAVDQMVTAAAARLEERFAEIEQQASSLLASARERTRALELDAAPPVNGAATLTADVIELPATDGTGRTATRLDAAIERAVHRAFQA